jgi:hypothetical protein
MTLLDAYRLKTNLPSLDFLISNLPDRVVFETVISSAVVSFWALAELDEFLEVAVDFTDAELDFNFDESPTAFSLVAFLGLVAPVLFHEVFATFRSVFLLVLTAIFFFSELFVAIVATFWVDIDTIDDLEFAFESVDFDAVDAVFVLLSVGFFTVSALLFLSFVLLSA